MAKSIYSCPTCGGDLIHKAETANYYCLACGNHYDYDFSLSEDTESRAFKYLEIGEQNASLDLFNDLIRKNPNDSKINIGHFMATFGFTNAKDFNSNVILTRRPMKDLSTYKSRVDNPFAREFFEQLEATYDAVITSKEYGKKIPELEEKIEQSNRSRESTASHIATHTVDYPGKNGQKVSMEAAPALVLNSIGTALVLAVIIWQLAAGSNGNGIVIFLAFMVLCYFGFYLFLSIKNFTEIKALQRVITSIAAASQQDKKELIQAKDLKDKADRELFDRMTKVRKSYKAVFNEKED